MTAERQRTRERQRTQPSLKSWLHILLWPLLALAIAVPIIIAALSPLLAWRDPIYVMAGFAGVVAMALLLIQPLLVVGCLSGLHGQHGRKMHFWVGSGLLLTVMLHVAGLWVTSPPDVVDALLFRSPTPFSVWGVIALWAVIATALLGIFRRQLRRNISLWRFTHSALAMVVVAGSVIHAMQIEGTMGTVSKAILCALVLAATLWVIVDLKSWAFLNRR